MKRFLISLALLVIVSSELFAAKPLAEVETVWPGVKFEVMNVMRLDTGHVLLTVRVRADLANKSVTRLVDREEQTPPPNASAEDLESGKYEATAFTLVGTTLTDEATGRTFPSMPDLPATPYVGPNMALMALEPGSGAQMAVYLQAPPPLPPAADGSPTPQKVSILFPKAAKPMTGLLLPAEITNPKS